MPDFAKVHRHATQLQKCNRTTFCEVRPLGNPKRFSVKLVHWDTEIEDETIARAVAAALDVAIAAAIAPIIASHQADLAAGLAGDPPPAPTKPAPRPLIPPPPAG